MQQAGGATQRQHKLEVSGPQDAAEVEADRAADAMVAGQRAEVTGGPTIAARDKDPNAAAPAGDAAKDADAQGGFKPAKVVVNITEGPGGAIEYDAKTYLDLYKQVAAREASGLEAGSCECGAVDKNYNPDPTGQFITATFTAVITTSLPTWKQYATGSDIDRANFDKWAASVRVHEARHAKVFLDGYAKLRTEVKGPTADDCEAQFTKVDTQVAADHVKFDADKSQQPASLPPPGGVIKVPSSGVPAPGAQPKASDDGAGDAPAGDVPATDGP